MAKKENPHVYPLADCGGYRGWLAVAMDIDKKMMGHKIFVWLNRHWKLAWVLCLFPVTYWAMDREPPLKILAYHRPAPVHAGGEVTFNLDIDRDAERLCDAEISRQLKLSTGAVRPYTQKELLSAQQIRRQDNEDPDHLIRTFPIPTTIPPGETTMLIEVSYRCDYNPLHLLWPIHTYLEWGFTVLSAEKP